VMWPNYVFSSLFYEIELQKISYDVILVTSWPLCHQKRHKIFLFWPPTSTRISGYASTYIDIDI